MKKKKEQGKKESVLQLTIYGLYIYWGIVRKETE